jgi:two-component system chemotaxis response regulator CheB
MPVDYPKDQEQIQEAHVYLAPPDFHMTVEDGRLRVLQGPNENRSRPAIDPLFRTAARYHGRRVLGVILTGMLDDGALGLMAVKANGGGAIVQDPQTALFPGMPTSALEQVPGATVLPLAEIAAAITRFAGENRGGNGHATSQTAPLVETADEQHRGRPSPFACPDCGGVLWEVEDQGFLHFRCRVGHAFTTANLEAAQREAVETSLWSALRALEERAALYRRMADSASTGNLSATVEVFQQRASHSDENARVLRQFLLEVNREAEQ